MRIIGGTLRGRVIKAPEGRDATRPTTDRVREALTSSIISRVGSLEGLHVLDAFAGSGALGFEMISRGAACATLCDQDQHALTCMRANIASLRLAPTQAHVVRCDVFLSAQKGHLPGAPFDVVLLDPPYATPVSQVIGLVEALADRSMLNSASIVVYERNAKSDGLDCGRLLTVSSKTYGSTAVDIVELRP